MCWVEAKKGFSLEVSWNVEKSWLNYCKDDALELCVCNGGVWAWCVLVWACCMLVFGSVLWGGFWTLGYGLWLEECGGMVNWVVTMVDGVEDDGMVYEIIGMVEGELEVALLFLGSKLGSIMIVFCIDVVGMEDKSRVVAST